MKTTFRYLSLNTRAAWHRHVEAQLKHLHSLTAIISADVVLEHQRQAKPAFRVQVRLEVPGPGMHAKATRHTREAAHEVRGLQQGVVGAGVEPGDAAPEALDVQLPPLEVRAIDVRDLELPPMRRPSKSSSTPAGSSSSRWSMG